MGRQTVFIAGGAGYLGTPLCRHIAEQGSNLCIGDVNPKNLAKVVAEIKADFPQAHVLGLHLDIGDEAAIKTCLSACVDRFGGLDGLVNATAGASGKHMDALSADDFNHANMLNLTGPFLMVREAAKYMSNGGSIVMFASMYGLTSPNAADYPKGVERNPIEYGAGKAGMIQMVRYLAGHYGRQNIRVNGIAPGPFPNVERLKLPADFINNLEQNTMLRRIGNADECAGPVAFLLSDAASYITGHTLPVDGGWTAW